MKFENTAPELKPYCEFACMVCMMSLKATNPKYIGCASRNIGKEYCFYLERALEAVKGDPQKLVNLSNIIKIDVKEILKITGGENEGLQELCVPREN